MCKKTDSAEEVEKGLLAFDARICPENMLVFPKSMTPETQTVNSMLEDCRTFLMKLLKV